MGVTYSLSSEQNEDSKDLSPQLENLRVSYEDADRLINAFYLHQFQPVMEAEGLQTLFYAAYGQRLASEMNVTMTACQLVFKDAANVIYTHEVLVAIALLAHGTWNHRAKLLFNVFKCIGTEEMGYEDIILAAQVASISLCRIWGVPMWETGTLATMSESIADNAFTKLEKELDDGVGQDKFVLWTSDRFRESKTIATSEALLALYSSTV